jgi:hypothetical protein
MIAQRSKRVPHQLSGDPIGRVCGEDFEQDVDRLLRCASIDKNPSQTDPTGEIVGIDLCGSAAPALEAQSTTIPTHASPTLIPTEE